MKTSTITGTSNFKNLAAALAYYADYGYKTNNAYEIRQKLANGDITIGMPMLPRSLDDYACGLTVNAEGRYVTHDIADADAAANPDKFLTGVTWIARRFVCKANGQQVYGWVKVGQKSARLTSPTGSVYTYKA